MSEPTPTPWIAEKSGGKGAWIKGANGTWAGLSCGDSNSEADANAALIVRTVNVHADLVECLQMVTDELDALNATMGFAGHPIVQAARATLRKATP